MLFICETCVRDLRPPPGEASRGRQLADRVLALAAAEPVAFTIRVVACLSGCPKPCNIALRGRGKYALRFNRLGPDHAEAVLVAAARYAQSGNGNLDADELPETLRERLSLRIAPLNLGATARHGGGSA